MIKRMQVYLARLPRWAYVLVILVSIYGIYKWTAPPSAVAIVGRYCKGKYIVQEFKPFEEVFGPNITEVCIVPRSDYGSFKRSKGGDVPDFAAPFFNEEWYYNVYIGTKSGKKGMDYRSLPTLSLGNVDNYTFFTYKDPEKTVCYVKNNSRVYVTCTETDEVHAILVSGG